MKNNEMDKKRIKIEQGKPYDPLEVAKAEGKLYSVGLSGKYKKNAITRIGFFLIGGGCLLGGLICIVLLTIRLAPKSTPDLTELGLNKLPYTLLTTDPIVEFICWYIYFVICLAIFIMGIFIVKNALRRK